MIQYHCHYELLSSTQTTTRTSAPSFTSLLLRRAAGTALQSGSLLARGCEATAMLAGHSADIQKIAWAFGHHLGVAHAVSTLPPILCLRGLYFFVATVDYEAFWLIFLTARLVMCCYALCTTC